MSSNYDLNIEGPFRSEHIRNKDPYELSNGHAIQCMPTGGRGSKSTGRGFAILETDPDVDSAGVDTGFSPVPNMLRAPDVAVGNVPNEPGWVKGVPALAVEYADTGQEEESLSKKIEELFNYGTKYIWVVRLTGPQRVEVYEPNKSMRRVVPGEVLTAPGVLRNPVPVEALYDRDAAHEVTLRNLLQRKGFDSLEAVAAKGKAEGEAKGKAEGEAKGKAAGKAKGKAEAILAVLASRGLAITAQERLQILGCISDEILQAWLMRVSHINVTAELFQ